MADKIHLAGTGEYGEHGTQTLYVFHCPGCGYGHGFHVPRWSFNGSFDKPTFRPNLLCNKDIPEVRCHSWVTDGRIEFLEDSFHSLKGQTVDLPDWE